jgi:hypothetical protein
MKAIKNNKYRKKIYILTNSFFFLSLVKTDKYNINNFIIGLNIKISAKYIHRGKNKYNFDI